MLGVFGGFNLPNFTPLMPGGRPKNVTAQYLNDIACIDIFNRLTNIALSRYKWINLPSSCNERALEETLYFYGMAVMFNHPDLGIIHTPVNLPGPFNIYYESIVREAYSHDFTARLTIDNSVVCKASKTYIPDYLSVWQYTPKIANALRSVDVQVETLKRPYLIKGNEKEVNSIRRALDKIQDNELAIVGLKFANEGDFGVLNLNVQSNLSDTWATIKNYFSQIMNSLGVRNQYSEKKERMITTEVEGEGNSTRHRMEANLASRKEFCKRVNEMFNLNIDVEANELEEFTDERIMEMVARVGNVEGMVENVSEHTTTEK